MDDPTDMALGISAAVGLALCGVCVVVHAWRTSRQPRLKESRSDPDLENLQDLVAESLPTHK
jgi:hypothetical protein